MKLQVGDPVVIQNVRRCTHGYNNDMLRFEGKRSVITEVYDTSYRVEGNRWAWDDNTIILDESTQYDADALFAEIMGG